MTEKPLSHATTKTGSKNENQCGHGKEIQRYKAIATYTSN